MTVLTGHDLTKYFGPDEIFSAINVEIPLKARIALVGPNGSGKTTLIHILAGLEVPTSGAVHVAKNTRIAYLPQRPELAGTHSLWDEQLRAFDHLLEMEERLKQLETQLADADRHDAALAEYGSLQEQFEHLGGYEYETRIKMVLTGVGFDKAEYDKPLPLLSGGQKTRALLARLLLEEPDLLILDEPTNHLDIHAVEWLENFLKDLPGAVLAVSHDRYFIDHFANRVWELEFKRLETYRGNYTHYMQQRDERREHLQKEYEAQQEFIQKEKDYIRKHMGSRWTAQAKGRLKKLNTTQKRGKIIESGPRNRKQMHLDMQTDQRSGDIVLRTERLAVGYDETLFTSPDILLLRGETAAVIGPNGVGKSTFLKTIIGELEPLNGEVRQGANINIGYFSQGHEGLNPKNSIIDEITSIQPMQMSEVRNFLGRYLFSGDDVFRLVETLSGGERGRVALAKLALAGANVLLLDEPTNHLDIDSQEILQAVLDSFKGTILLVSHDRYLIDALATQIWAIAPGVMTVFEGTYQEYITVRNRRLAQEQVNKKDNQKTVPTTTTQKKHGMNPFQLQQRLDELEWEIGELEHLVQQISNELGAASAAGDAKKVSELGTQYTQLEQDLEMAMEEWTRLAE